MEEIRNTLYQFSQKEYLIFGTFFVTIVISQFLKSKLYLFALFTVPATFLHELMHYLVSLLTFGKPVSFTFIPKRTEEGLTLGSVGSTNSVWYNQAAISLAPLLLFALSYYMLTNIDTVMLYIQNEYLFGYIAANMIVGALPSTTDLKLAIRAPIPILILVAALYNKYSSELLTLI